MAFCGSCGKEVADGVKFCPHCGNDTGVAGAAGSAQVVPGAKAQMDVFRIASLVIMGISMLSVFLPTLTLDAWIIKMKFSILNMWFEFGDLGMGMFLVYLFLVVATLGCVLCIGMGVKVFLDIFKKNTNTNEKQMIHLSMWGEVAAMVSVFIIALVLNADAGASVCGLGFLGWLMIILALLNIFVVTNKNVTDKIMGAIKK